MINLVSGSVRTTCAAMGESHYRKYGGLLVSPRSGNNPDDAIQRGAVWAMDNDCFNVFDIGAILAMLERHAGKPNCLFMVAPDVVSDAEQTLIRFAWWQPIIRYYGFPVAFVLQNGQARHDIPFDLMDALFIGGDTEFKMGAYAAGVVAEAKKRGKWVHMGRVNSNSRARYASSIGCNSFDGTGYAIFKNQKVPQVLPYQRNRQLPLWSETL